MPSGKDECWLILDAAPGARLGIGTRQPLCPHDLRSACLDGTIGQLIEWKPVERGDFFYIPAGTIHAIGGGVTLVEIQQNADATYRLYDYGRSRDLHIEEGVIAARAEPYPQFLSRKLKLDQNCQLVQGPKFDLWLSDKWPDECCSFEPTQIIPISGQVTVDNVPAFTGDCLLCDAPTHFETSLDFMALIVQKHYKKATQILPSLYLTSTLYPPRGHYIRPRNDILTPTPW